MVGGRGGSAPLARSVAVRNSAPACPGCAAPAPPGSASGPAVVTAVQGRVLVGALPAMDEEGHEPEPDQQSEDDFAFAEAGGQERGCEPLSEGNGRIQHGRPFAPIPVGPNPTLLLAG